MRVAFEDDVVIVGQRLIDERLHAVSRPDWRNGAEFTVRAMVENLHRSCQLHVRAVEFLAQLFEINTVRRRQHRENVSVRVIDPQQHAFGDVAAGNVHRLSQVLGIKCVGMRNDLERHLMLGKIVLKFHGSAPFEYGLRCSHLATALQAECLYHKTIPINPRRLPCDRFA